MKADPKMQGQGTKKKSFQFNKDISSNTGKFSASDDPFQQRQRNSMHLNQNRYSVVSNSSFKEKNSIQERRMLRVSFQRIRELDLLGVERRYRLKQDPESRKSTTLSMIENERFLIKFYTCCALIPIGFVLGVLFYSLWYVSPKSHNLRLYQQDIYEWNGDQMATKMSNLEFKFQIVPGNRNESEMQFMDKPMSYEKDEIRLRERFFYEQAYFLKTQALLDQHIPAVYWVEDMVQTIK